MGQYLLSTIPTLAQALTPNWRLKQVLRSGWTGQTTIKETTCRHHCAWGLPVLDNQVAFYTTV